MCQRQKVNRSRGIRTPDPLLPKQLRQPSCAMLRFNMPKYTLHQEFSARIFLSLFNFLSEVFLLSRKRQFLASCTRAQSVLFAVSVRLLVNAVFWESLCYNLLPRFRCMPSNSIPLCKELAAPYGVLGQSIVFSKTSCHSSSCFNVDLQ